MDQYIGKMLDNRYEILDIIGVGGMAMVYKAYCHRLHRFVAVKILRSDLAADADFRRRFHDEAQAVAMLSHSNIVSVYDVSRSDELNYIVMELIDGITLKQYMKKKGEPLMWREALHYITQIMRALSHAHSRGIIHRDIKPQNIMVLKDGSVRVADFGIARVMSAAQNTLTQEALGSVHYISPEQAKGSRIDERADIYSAGVVLYEMLTGKLPFEGDSPVSVAIQHISSIPLAPRELNFEIPEALEAITLKAMAANAERRYKSADEMTRDLEDFRKNPNMGVSYIDAAEPMDTHPAEEPTVERRKAPPPPPSRPRQSRLDPADVEEEEEEYESRVRTKKKGSAIPIFIVVAIFLVGVCSFLWMFFLSDLFAAGEKVQVPDFTNMTMAEINEKYMDDEEFWLTFKLVPTTEASEEVEKDRIISQKPEANVTVPKGDEPIEITVVVSVGIETVDVPDLTNYSVNDARIELERLGLTVKTPSEEVFDNEITAGYVVTTSPAKNEVVAVGGEVLLYVSKGPEQEMTTVPYLLGETEASARKLLERAGLGVRTREVDSDQAAGTVVGQDPGNGVEVAENTTVTIQISKGPQEPERPDETEGIPKKKTINVTLPDDKETVVIKIEVGSTVAYEGTVNVAGTNGVFSRTVESSGTQTINIYFDGVLNQQYSLNFDE